MIKMRTNENHVQRAALAVNRH